MSRFRHTVAKVLVVALAATTTLTACHIADIRPKSIRNQPAEEHDRQHGVALLDEVIDAHGLHNLSQFSTYEMVGRDHYRGLLGALANPWDLNDDLMSFRFTVGDFDGRLDVIEGKKSGFAAGLQSWDYYEGVAEELDSSVRDDKAKVFNIAAFHYFMELAVRLRQAPFITYIGPGDIDGRAMERVYVSWDEQRTRDFDQYILWIGAETHRIEAATFTIRENPVPGSAFLYGSLRFDDYRDIDGVWIPHQLTASAGNPTTRLDRYTHQFTIEQFTWDPFAPEHLRPFEGLAPAGDVKP